MCFQLPEGLRNNASADVSVVEREAERGVTAMVWKYVGTEVGWTLELLQKDCDPGCLGLNTVVFWARHHSLVCQDVQPQKICDLDILARNHTLSLRRSRGDASILGIECPLLNMEAIAAIPVSPGF